MQPGEKQLGEMQHFNTTPFGEMQPGEMQFGEMQLSPFCNVAYFYMWLVFRYSTWGSVHFENFYYKNLYFIVWLKYFLILSHLILLKI